MGRVKEFAYWLALCVSEHGISEEEIVVITSIQLEDPDGPDKSSWLRRQIKYIKQNPEVFGHGSNKN